nr:hypothetical protein [Colwellia sp.]
SLASLASKYQSWCSLKISQIFSGFLGGGVAQLDKKITDKMVIHRGFTENIIIKKINKERLQSIMPEFSVNLQLLYNSISED